MSGGSRTLWDALGLGALCFLFAPLLIVLGACWLVARAVRALASK